MHAFARQPHFQRAVAAVARIAKSETIPIVGCVRVTAKRGHGYVEVVGTDLDLSLRFKVEATIEQAGTAVVPAKVLADALKGLPAEDDVEIRVDDQAWVEVSSGETRYRLAGLPAEDFPAIAEPEGDPVALPAAGLARLVARVRMAITGADARYYLSGALMSLGPEGLELAATDGHRISVSRVPLEGAPAEKVQVIVARPAVDELPGLLEGAETVTFRRTETLLSWQVGKGIGERVLTVKPVEGNFPQHQRVFEQAAAQGSPWKATLARLQRGINRVRAVGRGKGTCVQFQFGAAALQLKTESADVGSATDLVPLEGWSIGPQAVGLNAGYVLEFLSAAHAEGVEEVRGRATGQEYVVLFEPVAEGVDWSYGVMPMRF